MKPGVGFIGLGTMGMGMARNIMKAGYPLVVYDLRAEPMAVLASEGAVAAHSPQEIGGQVDTVVLMVMNSGQTEEALLGPRGAALTLKPGSTVIGCSTISPRDAKKLAAALAERALNYVDAPVSGGMIGAAAGSLTIMVGAEAELFAAQRPLLEAMSANLYHCGPVGTGQVAKMCNQLMVSVNLVATAECLTLAAAAGMDRQLVYDVITHGAGDSLMFRNRAPRMIAGDTTVTSRLDIFIKDLGIVLEAADQAQIPLLVSAAARQWLLMGAAEGLGPADCGAIVKVMERIAHVSVESTRV